MEQENSTSRDYEVFSPDPGVPRFEGQGREALDLRKREPSNLTWPREPRYEGQAKSRRLCSEQPGVSRVRDTEVYYHDNHDGELRRRKILRSRCDERSLHTPSRLMRSRSPSSDRNESARERRSKRFERRCEDEVRQRSRSRLGRKRNRSLSRDSVFPFVSIVRFANTDCASTNTMNGTCLARRECNNLNGTITGTCASRRGRCCIVSRTCGQTTNVNNTYFTSPGYPAAYAGGAACSIIINRCNANVCQLRIDFLDLVLAQPDGDGVCATDAITVTGSNSVVPTLCGDNTGQTIFVDFNQNTAITITVTATIAATFSRRWNIRLTQLGCDCPGIAPNGCLQYYTGLTGTIRSFNYGAAANAVASASLVTGTRQIANTNYGICIRMEAGFCSIQYAQSGNDIFSFTVTNDVEGSDNTVLGTVVGASNGLACTTDFVVIANPIVVATGVAVGTDRFCGVGFVPVTSNIKPFVLYVVTDANEGATVASPPDVANRGFSLAYTQIGC